MKILFIGNSYTYFNDLPAILKELAEENGRTVEVFSVTKGGWKLHQYLDVRNEYAEKLDALLEAEHFDVTVLQEQSLLPILDPAAFLDGASRLSAHLAGKTDRTVLYVTWGRKEGSAALTEHNLTRAGMTAGLIESYETVARAISAEVSHVGRAFLLLNEKHPEIELHNPDRTHPSRVGSCLAAAVHYRTIFGEAPKTIASLGLDEETEAAIRAVI